MDRWLEKFKEAWLKKDLPAVLGLFDDKVMYYETPFVQLNSKKEIQKEWQGIKETENIKFNYDVFVKKDNKSVVTWELYYDYKGESRHLKGTYLIELNAEGLCTFFQQTCESSNN